MAHPNELVPDNPVPVDRLPPGGHAYNVRTDESWSSVAGQLQIDAWDLIDFNFPGLAALRRTNPEKAARQTNWYLREYIGCRSSKDGENWDFETALQGGKGAWKGGVIYTPKPLGKTPASAVPPTFGLIFRRYAPFKEFGRANPYTFGLGYFEGDNRGVSTSLRVSSRTYGIVMFSRDGVSQRFFGSSGTHFHPAIGDVIVGMSKVSSTYTQTKVHGPDRFGFRASTAGNNPLVKPSPNIDTFVEATVDFGRSGQLRVWGEAFGDNFPNLEIFILCYRSARTALLLDGQTTGGPSTGPGTRLYTAHEWFSLGRFDATLSLDQKGELRFEYRVGPTKLREYMPAP